MKRADKVRTLSLFSGAGGLDIGFHRAGYEIVAAVEIEAAYAATLAENATADGYFGPGLRVHCEDIRSFDPTPYMGIGIECVIGGPPCQTFSAAGRRSGGVLGLDDERGQLFKAYIEVLNAVQPRVFVFENVYGLPGANGGNPWREIVAAFAAAGYQLRAEVVDAADYGAPQHRERLIMVGWREDESGFEFPVPSHGPDSPSGRALVTARQAIADVSDPNEEPSPGPGGLYGHLLPHVPPGLNYAFFTREMGHPAPQFAWRSKFHDFLHKADPDAPVRTIKSKPGKFTGPFHWLNRHFSPEELKRLQSFPDEYKIVGNYNKVVEQIGNSVPPALAQAMAEAVLDQMLRPRKPRLQVRDASFKSTFRDRQRERTRHFKQLAAREIARHAASEALGNTEATGVAANDADYFVGFTGWFNRAFHIARSAGAQFEQSYSVKTRRRATQLDVAVARDAKASRAESVKITITGLAKYMDHTDEMHVSAQISDLKEMMNLWAIIEYEMVRQSRFFSLIDVYGHYANRGDTVVVTTHISPDLGPDAAVLSYFGSSTNCGVAMSAEHVAEALNISSVELPPLVSDLRSLRWDLRTKATHPTLGWGVLLCTYPFPALSAKAHFDKKAVGGFLDMPAHP